MRKNILLLVVLLFSWTLSNGQDTFWKLLSKEEYAEASKEAENLANEEFDYLYLAAICSHLNYDYNRYYQFSDYYLSQVQGESKRLTEILKSNYDESSYIINNYVGVVKQLNPSVELNSPEYYFTRSLDLKKTNPIAHNYMSMISIQNGQFNKGIEHAKKSISFDTAYPEPYNNLAFGLYKTGDKEGAVDYLLECLKKCPKNTNSTYMNYIQLACEEVVLMVDNSMFGAPGFTKNEDREELIEALKIYPENYLSMVNQFLSYSSYTEAGILLEKFTPSQETNDRYYYLLGILGIYSNSSSKVNSAVDSLIKNDAFDNALELGNEYFQNQQFEEASKIYLKIVPIARTSDQRMKVHANHGTALLQLQKHDEAIEVFKNVLEFAPEDDITLTNIGIVYALKEDKAKSREYLELAKKHCQSDQQMAAIDLWMEKVTE
ncbi:tetratricopeptide repeat protein [Marinoscillum sp.]|uniref:tetratricopeptide repeat protein n=1 Tax=Marinoscillum sp. TaxID=2024838 RepID=UPI003BACBFCA